MNKKGDFGLSVILLILIIVGIAYYQEQIQSKQFIGDDSTKIVYNLRSDNPNCNYEDVRISPSNHRLFTTLEDAIAQGFQIDENCN